MQEWLNTRCTQAWHGSHHTQPHGSCSRPVCVEERQDESLVEMFRWSLDLQVSHTEMEDGAETRTRHTTGDAENSGDTSAKCYKSSPIFSCNPLRTYIQPQKCWDNPKLANISTTPMQWSHKGKLQKNKEISFPAHQDSAE